MYCGLCGAKLEDGVQFCPVCGAAVGEDVKEHVTLAQGVTSDEEINAVKESYEPTRTVTPIAAKGAAIVAGIFLIAFSIGIIINYLFQVGMYSSMGSATLVGRATIGMMVYFFAGVVAVVMSFRHRPDVMYPIATGLLMLYYLIPVFNYLRYLQNQTAAISFLAALLGLLMVFITFLMFFIKNARGFTMKAWLITMALAIVMLIVKMTTLHIGFGGGTASVFSALCGIQTLFNNIYLAVACTIATSWIGRNR